MQAHGPILRCASNCPVLRALSAMSDIPENWRIDRIPTKRQRIFTIIISGFLTALFGILSGMFAWSLLFTPEMREKENIYFFLGVTVFLIISVYVLLHTIRGKYKGLSAFKAKLIGYLVLLFSAAIFLLALFKGEGARLFYLLSLSFTGVPMGISIIKQGKALEERT